MKEYDMNPYDQTYDEMKEANECFDEKLNETVRMIRIKSLWAQVTKTSN